MCDGVGAVISGRKSELVRLDGKVNSEIYIQNVLLRHAIPFINTLGEGIIYMHDNAPAHRPIGQGNFFRLVVLTYLNGQW